jgi:hypothetical protein
MWLGSSNLQTLGAGQPSPGFGPGQSGAQLPPHILKFLQSMQGGSMGAAPGAVPPSFEQQLMTQGGYTTPPASPSQSPFIQQHPGINPALAGILANVPPRPTGLPPGLLTAPGIVDKPRDWTAKPAVAPIRPGRDREGFGRGGGGRRGDIGGGGRGGWGGPEGSRDRAERAARDRSYDRSMHDRTGGP